MKCIIKICFRNSLLVYLWNNGIVLICILLVFIFKNKGFVFIFERSFYLVVYLVKFDFFFLGKVNEL